MAQVIQHKRRVGAGAAGGPAALAAGELAYNANGHSLHVGADTTGTVVQLVGIERQLEIHAASGNQTVLAGTKTWAAGAKIALGVADLALSGGATGNILQTDGTGVLSWVVPSAGVTSADAAEIAAGTIDNEYVSPLGLRSQLGTDAATLTTVAKTVVPAINELQAEVNALALEGQFAGSFDAATGVITWAPNTGAGAGLPAAAVGNSGWYVIAEVAGAVPPTGGPAGTYNVGDWIISSGTAWTHLAYGGIATQTASMIPVTPPVAGGNTVQLALEGLETANVAQDTAIANCVLRAGDTMGGALILFNNTPVAPAEAAAKAYVDTKVSSIAAPAATDNVVVYSGVTGQLIKDGGTTLAGIQGAAKAYVDTANATQDAAQLLVDAAQNTDINTRLLRTGDALSAGDLTLFQAPTAPLHAATKAYVDAQMGSSTVVVTGPALTGDGSAANPITFSGIVTEPLIFGGNGLTATPLLLLSVDGGTY